MNPVIPKFFVAALLLSLSSGCSTTDFATGAKHEAAAERFFCGVHDGDASVVDELAAEEIVISYPMFQGVVNPPVLVGKDAVREFVNSQGSRWRNLNGTIHEVVTEGDTVVLVWSLSAPPVVTLGPGNELTAAKQKRWGGITVFRFDQEGKIVSEFGEQSEPGPIGRLSERNSVE